MSTKELMPCSGLSATCKNPVCTAELGVKSAEKLGVNPTLVSVMSRSAFGMVLLMMVKASGFGQRVRQLGARRRFKVDDELAAAVRGKRYRPIGRVVEEKQREHEGDARSEKRGTRKAQNSRDSALIGIQQSAEAALKARVAPPAKA